jgi:hypothetical protein
MGFHSIMDGYSCIHCQRRHGGSSCSSYQLLHRAYTSSMLPSSTIRLRQARRTTTLSDCQGNTGCENVVNIIADWDTSVNQVSDFLNNAGGLQNPDLTTAKQNALNFAN